MRCFIAVSALLVVGSGLAGCADRGAESASSGAAGSPASPASACATPYSSEAAADIGKPPIDFRGTWVLNTDRGANLGMMKAVKETIVASQTADSVTFDMTDVFAGMNSERSVSYDLTGAAVPNKAAMGAESETTSQWQGNTLVTTWAAEGAIAGTTSERTETRCLTDDGETLNITMTKAGNPALDDAIWFVFEKAE